MERISCLIYHPRCIIFRPQSGNLVRCPVDPYQIIPDKCKCVDYQTLKLQENPEDVPHGEMPRHLQLYCDRYLTDNVAPGNRVTIVGVFSIKKMFQKGVSFTFVQNKFHFRKINLWPVLEHLIFVFWEFTWK